MEKNQNFPPPISKTDLLLFYWIIHWDWINTICTAQNILNIIYFSLKKKHKKNILWSITNLLLFYWSIHLGLDKTIWTGQPYKLNKLLLPYFERCLNIPKIHTDSQQSLSKKKKHFPNNIQFLKSSTPWKNT